MSSQYVRGTVEHVQHHLREWGVPERVVETVVVEPARRMPSGVVGIVKYYGNLFAEYKYFDGIEQPLFLWHQHERSYNAQGLELREGGLLVPRFRLTLFKNGKPCLHFCGTDATEQLSQWLMTSLMFTTNREAGGISRDAELIYQEFANNSGEHLEGFTLIIGEPRHAQAVVDYINANYRPKL